MPKIISYTPPWLSRPSPASQAFTTAPNHDSASKRSSYIASPTKDSAEQLYCGPHRLLAQRGTEIFVVAGNQIRWLDLCMVKNEWEEQKDHVANRGSVHQQQDQSQHPVYRVRRNDHV